MRARLLVLLVLTGVLASACAPAAPTTPSVDALGTAVAQTLQAMPTSTVPPATEVVSTQPVQPTAGTNGIPVSGEGVSFVIPEGVATGATIEAIPEASGADVPPWGIHPAHVQVTLEGYPIQGSLLKPQIFVFPIAEFAQLSDAAAQAGAALKDVLGRQGALPPGPLPFLPVFNAGQVFYSNALSLPFASGTGVRFVTQFDQAPLPINNNELLYTYQGLSSDGKYYVAAVLPVNVAFLPADAKQDSPTPNGGVPFDWTNFESMPAYLEAVRQKLEATDPSAFTPALSGLDSLVQSLQVQIP